MAIILNHTIVAGRDKAEIFGLKYEGSSGHFAPVRVNETLTLHFDNNDRFDIQHYAVHVSDPEFDAMLKRVQEAGLAYGSDPWNLENKHLNSWDGGRSVCLRDPNGHIVELMTRIPSAG
jgi:catechol 2,3-dioxygenase-like lactoylglutathione lyase family enzyme